MRFRVVVLGLCLIGGTAVRGQTPAEMARTAAYLADLQNSDGGFGDEKGGPSSLGATSSAVRMLGKVAGSVPDIEKCRDYVRSCFDPKTGGFAATPGGAASVGVTASGLMAVGEMKIATEPMVTGAIGYFSKNVGSFEEIRIAVAGLEAVKKPSPDFPRWIESVNATRNADGTWGEAATRPRMTGSAAVALLRMGVDLDKKEAILAALRTGQQLDGGWSRDGTKSDLETTYRIMRYFFMTRQQPDLDALRKYLSQHRRPNGAYSSNLMQEDNRGTYYCTTVERWARILAGEPAVVETVGFAPLFNGKDLDGWEGDTQLWTARDGMIVGTSPGMKRNDFLATTKTYGDFILKATFRLRGDDAANSGIQFRSVRVPDHEMSGYQADIGKGYWGTLYDESRRNKALVPAAPKTEFHPNEWNSYVVRCMGNHITLFLNGTQSADYVEKDAGIAADGHIALQIHAGQAMTIEFKDLAIQPLPVPTADDSDTTGFHLRTLPDGRKYSVFLPTGYDPGKTYPVVLFLHGSGERGDDGIREAQAGLGAIIAQHPERYPFIVVLPQARTTWQAGSDDASAAVQALDAVMKRHKIDPDRQILTGLSMGGAGAWSLAEALPDRFAAVVPVCGFGDPAKVDPIKNLPVWTFVGDDDSPRIVDGTRGLVDALRKLGAAPKITEYRAVGHNSWDRAYSDPELLAWMLARKK